MYEEQANLKMVFFNGGVMFCVFLQECILCVVRIWQVARSRCRRPRTFFFLFFLFFILFARDSMKATVSSGERY